jgi:hypothetical protein
MISGPYPGGDSPSWKWAKSRGNVSVSGGKTTCYYSKIVFGEPELEYRHIKSGTGDREGLETRRPRYISDFNSYWKMERRQA